MEKEERFLPIGTVVILKGGKRELMIMSYCIMPNGGEVYDKNGKVESAPKMFDYGACFYPEGMITSDQVFAFNHDQIDRVCFKGYETERYKEISKVLNGGLAEMQRDIEDELAKEKESPKEEVKEEGQE